jgi:hypothetical protein
VETDPLKESPGVEVRWTIQEFDTRTKTWKDIDLSELDEDFTLTVEFGVPDSNGEGAHHRIEFETQPRGPRKKHPPRKIKFETQPRGPKKKPPPKRIEFETQPR